ncbi:SCL locus [Pyrenophora seminiperda CCB06]|uniref:SCL locus n=1 Tax=Pyrenophora seminiperda CCB06 TaxID=1302712 RepID=A0A3M7M4C0_9PLEO|nr:SCL locus [Pyrenophora seminiperda CCB06]
MIRTLFILLQLRYAAARFQQGLPHQVLNITTTIQPFVTVPVTVNYTTTESCPTPTSTRSVYSIVYPSPDASPVEITAQSQVVTSYIPEMTWCVGPPIELIPITGPPYSNGTAGYTTVTEGTGSCSVMYSPIETTICATTLIGLGSKVPVTACDQEITFSTECGFTVKKATPITTSGSLITPAPSVKRVWTFWLAPWQSFTAGDTPSDVDVKICTDLDNVKMECIRYQEVWEVVIVTSTRTTEHTVQISTTVSGPGTLIVATATGIFTDTVESIDLSTVLLLETEIETESISSAKKPTATVRTTSEFTSTVFITKSLYHVSSR